MGDQGLLGIGYVALYPDIAKLLNTSGTSNIQDFETTTCREVMGGT